MTWEAHQAVTSTLVELSRTPDTVSDDAVKELERFTILLYDRTSTSTCINETRQLLFTRKGRQMQGLPPTKAALEQHIKRAVLQGVHDWGQAMIRDRVLPSPGDWGWTCPEKWEPLWTTLPQSSETCQELLHCRCHRRCTTCKCAHAQLKCTAYCTCRGDCDNI